MEESNMREAYLQREQIHKQEAEIEEVVNDLTLAQVKTLLGVFGYKVVDADVPSARKYLSDMLRQTAILYR